MFSLTKNTPCFPAVYFLLRFSGIRGSPKWIRGLLLSWHRSCHSAEICQPWDFEWEYQKHAVFVSEGSPGLSGTISKLCKAISKVCETISKSWRVIFHVHGALAVAKPGSVNMAWPIFKSWNGCLIFKKHFRRLSSKG